MGPVSLCCFTLWHTHTQYSKTEQQWVCVGTTSKGSTPLLNGQTLVSCHNSCISCGTRLRCFPSPLRCPEWILKTTSRTIIRVRRFGKWGRTTGKKSGDVWINQSDPAFIIITHSLLTVCEILFLCNQGSSREQTDYLHLYLLAY